jgi:hypothetical protein
LSGGDVGAVLAGLGALLSTVFGFILALRQQARAAAMQAHAEDLAELERLRTWRRRVLRYVVQPLRDVLAESRIEEPARLDHHLKYPPEDG